LLQFARVDRIRPIRLCLMLQLLTMEEHRGGTFPVGAPNADPRGLVEGSAHIRRVHFTLSRRTRGFRVVANGGDVAENGRPAKLGRRRRCASLRAVAPTRTYGGRR